MQSNLRHTIQLALTIAVLCAAALNARAATLTVTSAADSGADTLRNALASAANGDTIKFSVTGTILLTSGELLVTNSLTIIGPGPGHLAVNGNAASRVFHIGQNTVVGISSLTVVNGNPGGILNDHATLVVSNCTVRGNSTSQSGGGIYNDGSSGTATMTIANSTVSGNSAGLGGGIANGASSGSATIMIVNSTVSGNSAQYGRGGGILNGGTLIVSNSTVIGNSADVAGGIDNELGTLTIVNSTVSGNSAHAGATGDVYGCDGGGIYNYGLTDYSGHNYPGTLTIVNTTLSGNSAADYGGGIYNNGAAGSATATISDCTLSGNVAAAGGSVYNNAWNGPNHGDARLTIRSTILKAAAWANIENNGGIVTSGGYNLSSDYAGGYLTAAGDQINTDPLLGPLQDNGGPTLTHALLPGSPAIDKGKNFSGLATDQRGRPRPYDIPGIPNAAGGDGTDIGAFEFYLPALAIAPNSGNMVLSWSTNDPGYTAESTAVLPNSGSTWTTVPGTPLVIGNQYLLGDGPVSGKRFYRLRSP